MKVILLTDVKHQGKKDEVKDLKDGYAKYLINQNLAVAYTTKSVNILNNQLKDKKDKEDKLIDECNIIKSKLNDKTIDFKVKTGENDKVFGSISSKQISEKLSTLGYDIDKKKINIKSDIKSIGIHEVEIVLHSKVKFNIKIKLESEK